jgi:carbamoyltransferase
MKYVGFSEHYHDSGFAIINEDGVVEFATHGERYSKKKNDPLIPDLLWDMVSDDDHVSFYEDHTVKFDMRGGVGVKGDISHLERRPDTAEETFSRLVIPESMTYDVNHMHHESHCAAAFYTRPWDSTEDTVLVSIDGVGELQTATIMDADFNLIKEWHYPKSVGLVYTTVTKFLGLRPLEDEYVVMGLSAYHETDEESWAITQWLIDWYNNLEDLAPEIEQGIAVGDFETSQRERDRVVFREKLRAKITAVEDKVAARATQDFADYAIMGIMREASKYGKKLCYSGGCAQNVVINSRLFELFDEVHIAVSPTDAGSGLGTAARSWAKATGKNKLIWSPYAGYDITTPINPSAVVDHLLEHRYCGIANGRAEFGPRALGNRSLIADVRFDVQDTVNTIKRRQKYRPFAPAVLEEYAEEYFDGPMNEHMQFTSWANHDYAPVTHVDGSARVQIVRKDCESVFRKVIEEYYDRTGVPMLLNTSLNIRGRPMVNDEHDAELWQQKYDVKVF